MRHFAFCVLIVGLGCCGSPACAEPLAARYDIPAIESTDINALNRFELQLPLNLSAHNLQVRFELDSNLALLRGEAGSLSGKAWLEDPTDPLSIRSLIRLPVFGLRTGSTSRDETVREALNITDFPEVILKTSAIHGECSSASVEPEHPCEGQLLGTLHIRDVEKPVEIPYRIEFVESGRALLSGAFAFPWREFRIADPDIFLLRLDPMVTVSYRCEIPRAFS